MTRKATHPDKQLFDYLNGSLDAPAAAEVGEHLAACPQCASAAGLVRALKSSARISPGEAHPDASEIAGLFFRKSGGTRAETAAHVAMCPSCVEEIAEYARAQTAASQYQAGEHLAERVPAKAWEMIHEWEESSFAKPRQESEMIGHELLAKLFDLLSERKDRLRDSRLSTAGSVAADSNQEAVPVIVVDRSGRLRSIEMFEKVLDSTGAGLLKHAERSSRFDNRAVHVLRDAGGRPRVVSYRVQYDAIQYEEAGDSEETAEYFIIEE